MNSTTVIRRYSFKLCPRPVQDAALHRMRGLHSVLYNAALEERINQWRQECARKAKEDRRGLSLYQQQSQLKFIRAADPQYAALSATSMEMTLARLDNAFKAFFRRAKAGAGAQSGYPRFKRSADYPGFTFRRHGSGWRVTLGAGCRNGRVYLKGIPGKIRIRGKLPAPFDEIRTADVIWRDDAWTLSLVCTMAPRRVAGSDDIRINLNLIDEFARVTRTDGPCGAGLETVFQMVDGRITPEYHGVKQTPGADTPDLEDERRELVTLEPSGLGADTPDLEGERRVDGILANSRTGADTPNSRIAAIQQAMARCKKWSNRYRRLRARKAAIESKTARRRREALHVWTTAMVRESATLVVTKPEGISAATASGKGTERNHGAAVELKAEFNKHVLEQAPALAISMLAYKAEEAGIDYREIDHKKLEIGNAAVRTRKAVKRAKRTINREKGHQPHV